MVNKWIVIARGRLLLVMISDRRRRQTIDRMSMYTRGNQECFITVSGSSLMCNDILLERHGLTDKFMCFECSIVIDDGRFAWTSQHSKWSSPVIVIARPGSISTIVQPRACSLQEWYKQMKQLFFIVYYRWWWVAILCSIIISNQLLSLWIVVPYPARIPYCCNQQQMLFDY